MLWHPSRRQGACDVKFPAAGKKLATWKTGVLYTESDFGSLNENFLFKGSCEIMKKGFFH
jgi:hypothetical protein